MTTTQNIIRFEIAEVTCRRAVVFVNGVATGPGASEEYLENAKASARKLRDAGVENVRLRWVESTYTVDLDDKEILADGGYDKVDYVVVARLTEKEAEAKGWV